MNETTELTTKKENMLEKRLELPKFAPAVDIYENEDEILLHADMPGVVKEDVTVNVDNGRLEITGTRKLNKKGNDTWQEFADVEYRRVFSVPQSIDVGKVHAELKEGVLKLHLPKAESAKPRTIKISAL
jgi:HSP20 family molecular chaperone IbpA